MQSMFGSVLFIQADQPLTRDLWETMFTKALTIVSGAGVIVAQSPEIPIPDWAKLSVSIALVAVLGHLVLITFPRLFKDAHDAAAKANGEHTSQIKMITDSWNTQMDKLMEANRSRTTELGRKLDSQTDQLVRVLTGQPPVARPFNPEKKHE